MIAFNALKVIEACDKIACTNVTLSVSNKFRYINFHFEYEEYGNFRYFDYDIAEWEIDKFVNDLDDVLIGAFEFHYQERGNIK